MSPIISRGRWQSIDSVNQRDCPAIIHPAAMEAIIRYSFSSIGIYRVNGDIIHKLMIVINPVKIPSKLTHL